MSDVQTKLKTALLQIFPLRLSSIEQFHHFDCDESYPNLIYCRILIAGKINKQHALTAWRLAVERQPMFNAEVKTIGGELHWAAYDRIQRRQSVPNFDIRFEHLNERPTVDSIPSYFDTTGTIGPFLLVRSWQIDPCSSASSRSSKSNSIKFDASYTSHHQTELWFWIHHVACDGGGAVSFINDWLKLYSQLNNNCDPGDAEKSLRKIDQQSVKRRNRLGLSSRKFLKYLPHQLLGLFGATKFVFRKTLDLTKNRTPISDPDETIQPALASDWLSKDDFENLKQITEREGINLNATFMSSVFRAISTWRLNVSVQADSNTNNKTASLENRQARDWIRLILPISIRDISDRRLPAVNRTSIVQIDRRNALASSQFELARSVDREVGVIRSWQLDKMFLIAMRTLSIFESTLRRTARNPTSRGVAVFTNLGKPFREYERSFKSKEQTESALEFVDFDFVGPIRNKTPFNFAFAVFNGRLRISLHFDPRFILRSEANDLLHQLIDELKQPIRTTPKN